MDTRSRMTGKHILITSTGDIVQLTATSTVLEIIGHLGCFVLAVGLRAALSLLGGIPRYQACCSVICFGVTSNEPNDSQRTQLLGSLLPAVSVRCCSVPPKKEEQKTEKAAPEKEPQTRLQEAVRDAQLKFLQVRRYCNMQIWRGVMFLS